MSHDHSPPILGAPSGTSSSESSPPLSGLNTPATKPALSPIDTNLQRDSSGSSDGRVFPRHQSSVDRLRQDAQHAGSSRAPSVSSGHERNVSEDNSSRATSPHPSVSGVPSPRTSFTMPSGPGSFPRPYSSYSLTSQARIGGAPHQRHIQVEMPKPLGSRPDANGDFMPSMMRSPESMYMGSLDGYGQERGMRRSSRPDLHGE